LFVYVCSGVWRYLKRSERQLTFFILYTFLYYTHSNIFLIQHTQTDKLTTMPFIKKHGKQFLKKQRKKASYFIFALINISTIWGCYVMFYYSCQNTPNLSFFKILVYLLLSIPMGIIPALTGYYMFGKKGQMFDLQEIKEQISMLSFRVMKADSEQKMITLRGDSHKDLLALFPQELLYIESIRNYVRINYVVNGEILQKSFLATLTKMEKALSDYPFLIRCHHAFIVNLYRVEKITGYKICLKSTKTQIPISRTRKANVKYWINFIDHLSNN